MALNLTAKSPLALIEKSVPVNLLDPATDEKLYDTVIEDGKEVKKYVVMNIFGEASKTHRQARVSMQNKNLNNTRKKPSAEKQNEEWTDFLVKITESIDNLEYEGVACDNPTTIKALFEDPAFGWIVAQVGTAQGDTSAFLSIPQNA